MNPYITTFLWGASMRRLPWHVALRSDRRAILTGVGIAMSVAFCLASFAVPHRLGLEAIDPEGPFGARDVLITSANGGAFDLSAHAFLNATTVQLYRGTVGDAPATLAAFSGGRAPVVERGTIRPALDPGTQATLAVTINSTKTFSVGAGLEGPHIGRGWYVVHPQDLEALAAGASADATYVIAHGVGQEDARQFASNGLLVSTVPGIAPFFRASTLEVARDLTFIAVFTAVLIALLQYEFLRAEIHEQRRAIGLWRAVGMDPASVRALLLGRAIAISIAGAIVGTILAILGLALGARISGASVLSASIPLGQSLVIILILVASAIIGAAVPAFDASTAPVREQLEAPV